MVFGFSISDLLLVGVAVAVLGPKDVALVARTAGRLTGKAVAYVQKSRNQFGDILQRSQANQVHNELRETMAQLEAIRHEIHAGMSIMNPGPMTREILNSASMKPGTTAQVASALHSNPATGQTTVLAWQGTVAPNPTHKAGEVPPSGELQEPRFTLPQEMLRSSSFSEWLNAPVPETTAVDPSSSFSNLPGQVTSEGLQTEDIVVLPVSAVEAGLLPDQKGGTVTGADIVLESVIEQRVAFQALQFFEQQGAMK